MKRKTSLTIVVGICLVLLLAATALMSACAQQAAPAPAAPAPAAPAPAAPAPAAPKPAAPAPAAPAAPAKVYNLSLSDYQGPTIDQALWLDGWAKKMGELSNGRLNIRVYHAQTLLPSNNTWPGVAKGLADIGISFRYETFGKVFVDYMGHFSFGAKTGKMARDVFVDAYNKFPEIKAEWKDNKVFFWANPPGFNIHNSVRQLRTPEDAKGLQIRVSSAPNGDLNKAWGATPVFASIADSYTILQKGTAQGIHCGIDALMLFRFGELLKYTTWTYDTANNPCYLCMNWDTWNSLPSDLQKIINDSFPQGGEEYQKIMDDAAQKSIDWIASVNPSYKYYTPTTEEYTKWYDPLVPLRAKMAADIDAQGYPGTAIFKYCQERVQFYRAQLAK